MPRAPYTAPGHARTQPTPPAARAQVRALLDTIVHEAAALPDDYVKSLNPILRQAQAELSADLQRWLSKVPDGQERFTAQQYRTALLQLNSAMETLEKRLGGPHGAMAGTLIAQGAGAGAMAMSHLEQEVAAFSTVFGHSLRPVQLHQAAILAKGDDLLIPRYRNSAARYGADMTAEIRQQLAIGMARGETFAAMTDRLVRLRGPTGMVSLRGLQGSPAAYHEHIAEGLFVRYRHWAERIVRTEGLHAYNVHTDNGISELEAEDPGWVKRWDSTVDKRGCDICQGLDGKFADVKPAKKRKPTAPAPEPKPEDVLPADLRAPSKDEKKQAREAEKKRKAEEKAAVAEAKRVEQERAAAEQREAQLAEERRQREESDAAAEAQRKKDERERKHAEARARVLAAEKVEAEAVEARARAEKAAKDTEEQRLKAEQEKKAKAEAARKKSASKAPAGNASGHKLVKLPAAMPYGYSDAERADYKQEAIESIAETRERWGDAKMPKNVPGTPEAGFTVSEREFWDIRKKFADGLTPQELDACLYYSHQGDRVLNSGFRYGLIDKEPDVRDMADHLTSAINKHAMTEDTFVRRGMGGTWAQDLGNLLKPGDMFSEPGFSSTAAAKSDEEFDGEVRMRIKIPKGAHAAPIPTRYPTEYEFLLPPATSFRVVSNNKSINDDGMETFDIEVEVVP